MSGLVLPTNKLPSGILPENWYCAFDKYSQKYYYFNTFFRERTWNLENVIAIPFNRKTNQNPFLNTTYILPPPSINLKSKWIECESLNGKNINYYNPHTCKFYCKKIN
jgi:hypothetical protein